MFYTSLFYLQLFALLTECTLDLGKKNKMVKKRIDKKKWESLTKEIRRTQRLIHEVEEGIKIKKESVRELKKKRRLLER